MQRPELVDLRDYSRRLWFASDALEIYLSESVFGSLCRIQKYVKEQVLQVVAIICKRSILGNSQTIQECLLRDVTQLLTSNNRDMVGINRTY